MTEIDAIKNAQRLYHIIQAIARIRRSVDGISKEDFFANEDKQGNVVRCIEIIGEAANHIDEEIVKSNPDVPWPSIIGMRNNLIHGYNEVNYTFVWAVIENDLSKLDEKARAILKGLPLPKDFTAPQLP